MPCCNDSEKDVLESWKNEKREKWKSAQIGKMYMKNNGTYFNLNKWIFVLQFTVPFVSLVKGNVKQLILELNLTNNFH
jgi:hypothetical protein